MDSQPTSRHRLIVGNEERLTGLLVAIQAASNGYRHELVRAFADALNLRTLAGRSLWCQWRTGTVVPDIGSLAKVLVESERRGWMRGIDPASLAWVDEILIAARAEAPALLEDTKDELKGLVARLQWIVDTAARASRRERGEVVDALLADLGQALR